MNRELTPPQSTPTVDEFFNVSRGEQAAQQNEALSLSDEAAVKSMQEVIGKSIKALTRNPE